MSFSSDIKEELSKVNNLKNKEILEAEFLGYILTGNTTNSDSVLEFITENEFNIERFYRILFNLEIEYEPNVRGKVFVATITIAFGIKLPLSHFKSRNFSPPKSLPKPASVTT